MSEQEMLERIERLERVVSHLGVAIEKLSGRVGHSIMGAAAMDMPDLYSHPTEWADDVTKVADGAKQSRQVKSVEG